MRRYFGTAKKKLVGIKNLQFEDPQYCREQFEGDASRLGFTSLEDWYNVTKNQLAELESKNIVNYHQDIISALNFAYPSHPFEFWRMYTIPKSLSENKENVKRLIEYVGDKLKVSRLDDWYHVEKADVIALVPKFNNIVPNLYTTLKETFPEHPWIPWKFQFPIGSFWSSGNNQRNFLENFAKEMNFKKMEDWYSVTYNQVVEKGGKVRSLEKSRIFTHGSFDTSVPGTQME
eukprot:TRINITY_DN14186_c0_g1_i1.p1 TRINITY_DN14186_c0_g1~~TRINITY_DN14186_c0_g1_i1.p1  ORF type:complete len:232 (-),score=48.50 TRINITY_DN14186_c0_g1_i1:115-810(-)